MADRNWFDADRNKYRRDYSHRPKEWTTVIHNKPQKSDAKRDSLESSAESTKRKKFCSQSQNQTSSECFSKNRIMVNSVVDFQSQFSNTVGNFLQARDIYNNFNPISTYGDKPALGTSDSRQKHLNVVPTINSANGSRELSDKYPSVSSLNNNNNNALNSASDQYSKQSESNFGNFTEDRDADNELHSDHLSREQNQIVENGDASVKKKKRKGSKRKRSNVNTTMDPANCQNGSLPVEAASSTESTNGISTQNFEGHLEVSSQQTKNIVGDNTAENIGHNNGESQVVTGGVSSNCIGRVKTLFPNLTFTEFTIGRIQKIRFGCAINCERGQFFGEGNNIRTARRVCCQNVLNDLTTGFPK